MSILVFVVGVVYALSLQLLMRPLTADGVHFHPWSSEDMMQTVSIKLLRDQPVQTLLNIHIQPPGFDAVRAVLALAWPGLSDTFVLRQVDRALYLLGSLTLGLLVAVVYLWLAEYGARTALIGSFLLLLHPALIFFATFLDSTLLSAFLVLCLYYLLWREKNRRRVSILAFSVVVLGLFFTRSIFQWPTLILFAVSLHLFGTNRQRIAAYLLATCLVAGAYLAKQHVVFGLLSTSSFAGVSMTNSIGEGIGTARYASYLDDPGHATAAEPSMPLVLTSKTKLGGQPNFNHIDYLNLNSILLAKFQKEIRKASIGELARSYLENASIYFRPTSTYSSGHVIVDHLPWTRFYGFIFSAPVLPLLLLVAFVVWCVRTIRSGRLRPGLGILLPGLYIMAASIFLDKGENMRFKLFLEPIMFVFIVSQCLAAARSCHARWMRPKRAH